jgi:acyl-CoA thioesterase-2
MFSELMNLRRESQTRFEGARAPDCGVRLFGGQFMAQSLMAAQATLAEDREAHSLHAYFLRPGDPELPIDLSVEVVRDGRTFSSRQVVAKQNERELFRMMVSFQTETQSLDYTAAVMPDVPPPEEVEYTYNQFTCEQTGRDDWPGSARPIDIRYINPPAERGVAVVESQLMWMRISTPIPDGARTHFAGLAYLSDSTVVDHLMLPHGLRWQDEGFEGASLDHALWFHRPARADEWLLFVQTAQTTGAGRGLGSGQFFDRAGNLVATCVQEGLMRWSQAT